MARKLQLSLVTVSRFAAEFETAPTYVNGREQALYRRQALRSTDQANVSVLTGSVWLPASSRPSKPIV